MKTWKHIRSVLLLPVMATIVILATLLYFTGSDTLGLWDRFTISCFVLPVIGVLFVGFSLVLIVLTIRLFATVGKGTLALWNPTQRLVVQGVYRHVRNLRRDRLSFYEKSTRMVR